MNDRKQISAKRFFGLDFLRALSISLLLFSHSSWIYNSTSLFGRMQDASGFLGVELFIVLSGFLIGGILYKQFLHENYGIKDAYLFVSRRLMRVLPSYYLVVSILTIVYMIFGFSVSQVWKYLLLIQNFAFPIPAFFPESWSLPVKEMGYILAVFLLVVSVKLFTKTSRKVLFLSVIIGLILLTFGAKTYYNIHSENLDLKQWSFSIRSVVIYRIDSVLIGVLFGYSYHNYKEFIMSKRKLFLAFGIILLALLFLCIAVFKLRLTNASWFWNILCLPLLSLSICMFLPILLNWKTPSERIGNLITFICNISYSVYLLHYSLVLFLLKYFINTSNFSLWQLHIFTILYVSITVVLSYLLYTFFEKPINEYRAKNFKLNDK
ncbi:MAG TPA: acyltransferase [Flavobacterium sp.]|uniref:acyltransferase family protein n=1 Tax=Flavobacterium sp. TaxID=239 RepID=UPI002BC113E8|nr:acyltransferase [Flavobacterium sp.]HNP32110.1 acyltransferase [Flavobacterium sp.]